MDAIITRWIGPAQLVVALGVSMLILALPGEAKAEWNFDESCSPATRSEVELAKGAAMLMLDRSGSMRDNRSELCTVNVCCDDDEDFSEDVPICPSEDAHDTCNFNGSGDIGDATHGGDTIRCGTSGSDSYCFERVASADDATVSVEGYLCGDRLWDVAVDSLTDVVFDLSDDLYFGLGFFRSSSSSSIDAWIEVEANESDLTTKIETALMNESPGGGTPTDKAIEEIASSETLTMDRSAGILITDGAPNDAQETIDATCDARDIDEITNYIIGLGGGTYTKFNNLQAGAAGTGCCGVDAEEGCPNGIGYDPCDIDGDGTTIELETGFANLDSQLTDLNCHGSYSATNYDEFTGALKNISNVISCTFPINVEHWDEGLPDDPTSVQVTVDGMYGPDETILHVSESGGEGWDFASSDRDSVTFTPGICDRVLDPSDISHVTTRPACHCETELAILEATSPADFYCQVPNVINSACPAKPKICLDGIMVCSGGPATDLRDACPWVNCPDLSTPESCHMENTPVINQHPTNSSWGEPLGSGDEDSERNRCNMGVLNCETALGAWCEPLSPMPELCDGLDNNCDGLIDNMSTGWEQVEDATYFPTNYTPEDGYPADYGDEYVGSSTMPDDAEYPGAACYEEDICGCSDGQQGTHGGLQAVLNGEDADAEFAEHLANWLPATQGGCGCVPSMSR